jgi:hypothetical protein
MKKLVLTLCILLMLPVLSTQNRAGAPQTVVSACEATGLGNACVDRQGPSKNGRPGRSRNDGSPLEIGAAGMVTLVLLNWIVRL